MAQLTVLDLGPDPRERGMVHGRAMRREIRDNYATYVERFQTGGAKSPQVLEQSDAWAAFIARDNPEYAEEMAGIAAGADLSLNRNRDAERALRTDLFRVRLRGAVSQQARRHEQEGCTSFGLLPEMTASGHTLIGQNWDWLQKVRGRVFIMRVKRSSEPGKGKPDFVGLHRSRHGGLQDGRERRRHRLMRQRPGNSARRREWISQAVPRAMPRDPGCLDIRQGLAAGGANRPLLFDEFSDRPRRWRNH